MDIEEEKDSEEEEAKKEGKQTPENSPVDLNKFEVSEDLKEMLDRIEENDFIDTPGIRMARARAKTEEDFFLIVSCL